MENLLSMQEAAEYLRVSYETLRVLTSRGQVPHGKVGGKYVFEREELLKWAKQNGK